MNKDIVGNFIYCGKPVIENGEILEYVGACVRLSEIKTIRRRFCEGDFIKNWQCVFYTYKDEWYIADMDVEQLACYASGVSYEAHIKAIRDHNKNNVPSINEEEIIDPEQAIAV